MGAMSSRKGDCVRGYGLGAWAWLCKDFASRVEEGMVSVAQPIEICPIEPPAITSGLCLRLSTSGSRRSGCARGLGATVEQLLGTVFPSPGCADVLRLIR